MSGMDPGFASSCALYCTQAANGAGQASEEPLRTTRGAQRRRGRPPAWGFRRPDSAGCAENSTKLAARWGLRPERTRYGGPTRRCNGAASPATEPHCRASRLRAGVRVRTAWASLSHPRWMLHSM
jgi:hypothetical protein